MRYLKADCTPEEWAARKAKRKQWLSDPLVRAKQAAKQRERRATEAVKAQRSAAHKEYVSRPGVKEQRSAYQQAYLADPDNLARRKAYERDYQKRKTQEERREVHKRTLARKFQLAPGFLNDLAALQNHTCAVCQRSFTAKDKPCVDHDHDTGIVRGLLCRACNTAEGMLKQTGLTPEEFGGRLSSYLENPPAKIAELL